MRLQDSTRQISMVLASHGLLLHAWILKMVSKGELRDVRYRQSCHLGCTHGFRDGGFWKRKFLASLVWNRFPGYVKMWWLWRLLLRITIVIAWLWCLFGRSVHLCNRLVDIAFMLKTYNFQFIWSYREVLIIPSKNARISQRLRRCKVAICTADFGLKSTHAARIAPFLPWKPWISGCR